MLFRSDAITPAKALLIMNRDGSGRRTLVAAEKNPQAYDWSADGRSIAWATSGPSGGDSMDLHIVEVRNGETSAPIVAAKQGGLNWLNWLGADTVLVWDEGSSFRYSRSRRQAFDRSADLEFQYQSRVPGWTVFYRPPASTAAPGIYIHPVQGGAERLVVPAAWICATQNRAMTAMESSLVDARI